MRVAIIQNRIIFGGRLQVLVHIIKLLNENNIVPDILSFSMNGITKAAIQKHYDIAIDYRFKKIKPDIPGELSILFFNMLLNKYQTQYDLWINSSNTSFLLPSGIPVLSYVHFPRKWRMTSPYFSIHDWNNTPKTWFRSKQHFAGKMAQILYRMHTHINQNVTVVCNSEFSRYCFKHSYPTYQRPVSVIYPPVHIEQVRKKHQNNKVLSLGRFCTDKNQLQQIMLFRKLPQFELHLVGFAREGAEYVLKCENYIKQHSISNVFLYKNASHEEKNEMIRDCSFFLHVGKNEPFGITTVEAIANGLIPVVPNNGGQPEIVPFSELRYNSFSEIPDLFAELTYDKQLLIKLQKNIQRFSTDAFYRKFAAVLRKFGI